MFEKINEDLKDAMRAKDKFKLTTLRSIKSSIKNEEINKKRELTEEEIISILMKEVKVRNDANIEFKNANREDLFENNMKEVEIINSYLPAMMTEEDINKLIDEVFEEVKPEGMSAIGAVMKELSPKVKGKADMGMVNKLVKEKLNSL